MGAGLNGKHDVLTAEDTRDRVHTTRDGLTEEDEVGLDSAPLVTEQLAGAGNTSLDLIADQQDIVLVAEGAGLLEVVGIGDDNTGFTLNGLDEESSQVGTGGGEGLAESFLVIVSNWLLGAGDSATDAREVRAIVFPRFGIGGERDSGELYS